MLLDHATSRDRHRVPLVAKAEGLRLVDQEHNEETEREINICNAEHHSLYSLTTDIVGILQQQEFAKCCIRKFASHNPVGASLPLEEDTALESERISLETKRKNAHEFVEASEVILRHVVSDISDSFPSKLKESPRNFPLTFIRMWNNESHTKHTQYGFRCSAWEICLPARNFDELGRKGYMTFENIKDYCHGTAKPLCWISLCDNVSWILKHSQKWKSSENNRNWRVAIISVPKMERLEVLWQQSKTLVTQLRSKNYNDGESDFVRYAWGRHYLAYGWIPAQCIVATFDFKHFEELCVERNIGPGLCLRFPLTLNHLI